LNQRIRILHIIDSFYAGGTEKQCLEIARRINGNRYRTSLVTLNKEGPLFDEVVRSGIEIHEFKISKAFYRPSSLIQILRLARFISKGRFDIVQTYGFYSTVPGVIAGKIAGTQVVIAGKRDMNELLSRRKIRFEKFLWRFCSQIVVNAKRIKKYLIETEGVQESKVSVIYNGVDASSMGRKTERVETGQTYRVGMIANFRKQKDHKTFLDACALILKKRTDIEFHLVGSGPREDVMRCYASELGLEGHVLFHGRKIGSDLFRILSSFSILVLCARNEGVSNVILEAMAMGVPVVANPSGGIPEIIEDGVTGYLVPYKDKTLLSRKIIDLLGDKGEREVIARNAKALVQEKFHFSVMCEKYEKLYKQSLDRAE
jgi:glycosyltransferase involved in cell wall biosynthesis